jgi:predicted HicB family RNase H-like nuclease
MKKLKPYKGYTVTVEFDADEMVLHGRVENIRDVVSFQAAAADDLQSRFEEAIDDYLDLCSERGETASPSPLVSAKADCVPL